MSEISLMSLTSSHDWSCSGSSRMECRLVGVVVDVGPVVVVSDVEPPSPWRLGPCSSGGGGGGGGGGKPLPGAPEDPLPGCQPPPWPSQGSGEWAGCCGCWISAVLTTCTRPPIAVPICTIICPSWATEDSTLVIVMPMA
eukprot:5439303-Pyramimonas_sp.AAC.1